MINPKKVIRDNGDIFSKMTIKKKNFDVNFDREKKIKIKQKNVLDKHRKLIYNIASSRIPEDDDEDLNYVYATGNKIKRR